MISNIKALIKNPYFRWGATIAYAGVIALLSLLPADAVSKAALPIPHFDKWVHGIMHGIFALLIGWALQYRLRHPAWTALGLAICVIYGILTEFAQLLVVAADRSFSFGDIAANTAGAGLATIMIATVNSILTAPEEPGNSTSIQTTAPGPPNAATDNGKDEKTAGQS